MSVKHGKENPPWLLLLVAFTAIYTLGHFQWYGQTALGMTPVLDGKEIIELSRNIAMGELPSEPFYRAPLYPTLLSILYQFSLPKESVVHAIRLLNGVFHLVSTILVYLIIRRIWRKKPAAFSGAILYGIYPVAAHFAGDALDITPAITLWLTGILLAVMAWEPVDKPRSARLSLFGAGLCFGLGILIRPHLLFPAAAYPFVVFWMGPRPRATGAALAAIGPALAFLSLGLMNLQISGQFIMLPTQGAYNLWAANRSGADSRYYKHSVAFQATENYRNPTRRESEIIYRDRTGDNTHTNITIMNRYWRNEFLRELASKPTEFTRRVLLKGYYLLNHTELYNNKTYAVHKAQSPWLRGNPLGWSLLLMLGTAGLTLNFSRKTVKLIFALAVAYSASLVLFWASARFRLPLAPVLCVLSAGYFSEFSRFWTENKARLLTATVAGALAAILSLTSFAGVDDPNTRAEDYFLMAHAANQLGEDEEAVHWAQRALERDTERPAVLEILCVSHYNLLLKDLPIHLKNEELMGKLTAAYLVLDYSEQAKYIAGFYHWLLGEKEIAVEHWRALAKSSSHQSQSALAALLLTDNLRSEEEIFLARLADTQKTDALLLAEWIRGSQAAYKFLIGGKAPHYLEEEAGQLLQLFGLPAMGPDNKRDH